MYFDGKNCEICSFGPVLCFNWIFSYAYRKLIIKKIKKIQKSAKKPVFAIRVGAQNFADRSATNIYFFY